MFISINGVPPDPHCGTLMTRFGKAIYDDLNDAKYYLEPQVKFRTRSQEKEYPMKRRFVLMAVLIFVLVLVACQGSTRGSGNVITEERAVSGFDKVALSGVGTVQIIQGDTESLTIEAEDNIMPLITSEVVNDTLILSQEENAPINPTKPINYTVSMIDIASLTSAGSGGFDAATINTGILALDLSGSGQINITTLDADSLTVKISGSGGVRVSGQVNDQQVDIAGSGEYGAADLDSNIVDITINGSGKAVVRVNDTLDANISGSALVSYYGDPVVTSDVTGSGAVEHLE